MPQSIPPKPAKSYLSGSKPYARPASDFAATAGQSEISELQAAEIRHDIKRRRNREASLRRRDKKAHKESSPEAAKAFREMLKPAILSKLELVVPDGDLIAAEDQEQKPQELGLSESTQSLTLIPTRSITHLSRSDFDSALPFRNLWWWLAEAFYLEFLLGPRILDDITTTAIFSTNAAIQNLGRSPEASNVIAGAS
ncbi:hypothetical protein HDU97_006496 [Phlyctochytrium planicorne]|nr:hypothetical protein HDU97_006496 [Phlyctochytrium planicorne]